MQFSIPQICSSLKESPIVCQKNLHQRKIFWSRYLYVDYIFCFLCFKYSQSRFFYYEYYLQVPVLEIIKRTSDGTGRSVFLTQSLAIIQYLDEEFPTGRPLLPKDSFERAKCREVLLYYPSPVLFIAAYIFVFPRFLR